MKYVPVIGCIWWLRKYPKSKALCIQQMQEACDNGLIATFSTIWAIFVVALIVLFILMGVVIQ